VHLSSQANQHRVWRWETCTKREVTSFNSVMICEQATWGNYIRQLEILA